MISIRQIEEHIQSLPAALLEIVVELPNLVQPTAPAATEEDRRNGLVYYWANRGGPVRAGTCQILIKPDHIRLAFIHGAFLPDPLRPMEGDTWPKRTVCIGRLAQAPWEPIQSLIEASSRFDPCTESLRAV